LYYRDFEIVHDDIVVLHQELGLTVTGGVSGVQGTGLTALVLSRATLLLSAIKNSATRKRGRRAEETRGKWGRARRGRRLVQRLQSFGVAR